MAKGLGKPTPRATRKPGLSTTKRENMPRVVDGKKPKIKNMPRQVKPAKPKTLNDYLKQGKTPPSKNKKGIPSDADVIIKGYNDKKSLLKLNPKRK